MCWSAESSANAYGLGTLASLILLAYGDRIDKNIGLFFLVVVQMQLIEYFIWKDPKRCGETNNLASKMIVPELTMQAVAMIVGAYWFGTTVLPKSVMTRLFQGAIAFAIITIIPYFIRIWPQHLCSIKVPHRGIKWDIGNIDMINSLDDPFSLVWKIAYYGALFWFPLLWNSPVKKYIFFAVTVGSWLWIRYTNKITWGSRWCFPAALIPTLYVSLMILGVK